MPSVIGVSCPSPMRPAVNVACSGGPGDPGLLSLCTAATDAICGVLRKSSPGRHGVPSAGRT